MYYLIFDLIKNFNYVCTLILYIDNNINCCNNRLKMNDLFSNFSRVFKIKYFEYFFRIYKKKKNK